MTGVDWILLAVLGASLLLGAWRGLMYELILLAGWVAAFVLAQWWAPEVAPRLPLGGLSEPVRYAAAFVLVFVGGAFAAGLIASIIRRLVRAVGLRPVDRVLGATFGLVRGVVLILALGVVMGMTPLGTSTDWRGSTGAQWVNAALQGFKPLLPPVFGAYLPT